MKSFFSSFLAVFLRGKIDLLKLGIYWVAQLAAVVATAYLTLYLRGHPALESSGLVTMKALLGELLFTFALYYVVLNVATVRARTNSSYFGFAIGLTVLAGTYAVGAISSTAFNPAVALGAAAMSLTAWSTLWVTIIASLSGAAAVALLFKQAHPRN